MHLKILFVTSTFLKSKDDEQLDFVYEIASAFKRNGHDVIVLAAHGKNALKKHEIGGIEIRRFQYWWPASMQKIAYGEGIGQNIKNSLLARIQFIPYIWFGNSVLKKIIRDLNPDV